MKFKEIFLILFFFSSMLLFGENTTTTPAAKTPLVVDNYYVADGNGGKNKINKETADVYESIQDAMIKASDAGNSSEFDRLADLQKEVQQKINNGEDVGSYKIDNTPVAPAVTTPAATATTPPAVATSPSTGTNNNYSGGYTPSFGSSTYNDSYLDAYFNGGSSSDANDKLSFKRNAIILGLGIINGIFAFAPLWFLIISSITALSNAPMNEHYSRVIQSEPYKFFLMSFVILIISYALHIFLYGVFEFTLLESYKPLLGVNGLTAEYWTLVPPDAIQGRYGPITLKVMNFIVTSREIMKMFAYFTTLLILLGSMFFVYSYFGSYGVVNSKGALVLGACVSIVVFLGISYLYDLIASPILNSSDTVLSIGREYIKTGVNFIGGDVL